MALADVTAHIFASRFERIFYQDNVWSGLAADMSAELAYGDTLELPTDSSTYTPCSRPHCGKLTSQTIADHSRNTPTPVNATNVSTSTLNKPYELNVLVGTALQQLIRPSFIPVGVREGEHSLHAAVQLGPTGRVHCNQRRGRQHPSGGVGDRCQLRCQPDGISGERRCQTRSRRRRIKADGLYWPQQGRYAVVSPDMHAVCRRYLIDQKAAAGGRGYVDRAVLAGEISDFFGWRVVKDNSVGTGRSQHR